MPVQRVENQKSYLGDGVRSAAVGAVAGYAAKYILPITNQEKDAEFKEIIETIKKSTVASKLSFAEALKNAPEKTLSQDAFVKATKGMARSSEGAFKLVFKSLRPSKPFIVAGAITGLAYSFIKNAFSA